MLQLEAFLGGHGLATYGIEVRVFVVLAWLRLRSRGVAPSTLCELATGVY